MPNTQCVWGWSDFVPSRPTLTTEWDPISRKQRKSVRSPKPPTASFLLSKYLKVQRIMEHYREFQQPPSPSPACRVSFLPNLLLDSVLYHVKDSGIKRWKKNWATNRNLKHWEMSSEQEVRPMESQGRERLGIPFRTMVFALFIYITSSPRTKLSLLFLIPQSNLFLHPMEKPEHSLRHAHHR